VYLERLVNGRCTVKTSPTETKELLVTFSKFLLDRDMEPERHSPKLC
jgi:hypothetical protein